MEKRREILRSKRVCRFCLKVDEPLTSIYDRSVRAKNSVPLPLQIMACVAIEVFPSDGMPGTICSVCRHFMDQSYRFKQICKQADEGLRHFLTHGDLREPIAWPRDMIKHVPENLISPVVQQTITVTEEEYSEGEEGESQMKHEIKEEQVEVKVVRGRGRPRKRPPSESTSTNVIITPTNSSRHSRKNISMDEMEEPPTKIRVTQRGEELLITAHGDDEADEDLEDEEELLNNQQETVETDVFPCPHCLRSFPLKQLLDIHQEQHTRERTHHCELCDRSFFTKFDLRKHVVVHSGIKPFKCVVCKKTFARLTLLRRHEKVHANVERIHCNDCSQSFITAEDLQTHIARKHLVSKPFKCDNCPKTFAFKQGLERHTLLNHNQEQPYRCNYCPLSFSSSTRLARHLQSHAGQRPYPCKFCPKSFLMSHHYMRHLRTKHIPKSGNEKTIDSYKCIQCDELFDKQDDLIFHSAVHATQDLTCPLCKEKFEDVDSVTMHIKSHIDGEQYVCEWCELVFTSEENLDLHIDTEHKDAMPGDGDPFAEITYLEGRLVDETELLQMNQSYEGEELEEEEEEAEEDSLYEASQQEIKEDAELEVEEEQEEEEPEELEEQEAAAAVEDRVPTDELSFQINVPQPVNSPQNQSEDESKPTYIELKTVAPTQVFTKKPIEIVQKNALTPSTPATVSPPKSSILQKAQEVKAQRRLAEEMKEKQRLSAGTQKVEIKSFKPIPIKPLQETITAPAPKLENSQKKIFNSQVQKIVPKSPVVPSNQYSKSSPIIKKIEILSPPRDALKDGSSSSSTKEVIKKIIRSSSEASEEKTTPPVSRTNEKSLKLLEKDLLELQKVAKSSNAADRYLSGSQRFLSRKPLNPSKRDQDGRDFKHSSRKTDDRDFRITAPKRPPVTSDDRDPKSSSKRDSSGSQDDRHSKIRPIKRDHIKDERNKESYRDFKKSSSGGDEEKERRKMSESSGDDTPSKKSSEVFKSPLIVKKNDGSVSVKKGFMQRDAEKNKSHIPDSPKASSSEDKLEDIPTRAFSPPLSHIKSEGEESERKSSISDEDAAPTRRSCRASKIKDYAAMIRDRSRLTREGDDSDDDSDDDYKQSESEEDPEDDYEVNPRPPPAKLLPVSTSTPLPTGKRGRGRPRKVPIVTVGGETSDASPAMPKSVDHTPTNDSSIKTPRPKGRPSKKYLEERARLEAIAKESGVITESPSVATVKRPRGRPPLNKSAKSAASPINSAVMNKPKQIMEKLSSVKSELLPSSQPMRIQKIEGVVQSVSASGKTVHMSPLGQTLKKVSAEMVRSLPAGVRPLPMPPRTQLTQMKIGHKTVRVQKILMTKAEVDAMAKKGLVEIKDGAVVLKAGVKLPASGDFSSLKSSLTSPNVSNSQPNVSNSQPNTKEPDCPKKNETLNTEKNESTPLEEKKAETEPSTKATLPEKIPAKPSRCQDDVLDPAENDIDT